MYDNMGTWRRVGVALGVNPGVAWKYAKTDYEPQREDLREALGLEPFSRVDYIRQVRNPNGTFGVSEVE